MRFRWFNTSGNTVHKQEIAGITSDVRGVTYQGSKPAAVEFTKQDLETLTELDCRRIAIELK